MSATTLRTRAGASLAKGAWLAKSIAGGLLLAVLLGTLWNVANPALGGADTNSAGWLLGALFVLWLVATKVLSIYLRPASFDPKH